MRTLICVILSAAALAGQQPQTPPPPSFTPTAADKAQIDTLTTRAGDQEKELADTKESLAKWKSAFEELQATAKKVDAERDFIAGNLSETRLVTHEEYLHCINPVFKGKTATGGNYYSDSRMLLVELNQVKSGSLDLQLDTSNFKRNTVGAAVLINASR